MSDEYVHHLLDCAKWYHHRDVETSRLPDTFESERSVFEAMRDTLLSEAHEAMMVTEKEDGRLAKTLVYNAVDLTSSSPGIATDREGSEVKRGDGTVRQVAYDWKGEATCQQQEQQRQAAEYKKSRMSRETARKRAEAGMKASEARRVKSLERTEKKAELDVLSPEERKEHRKRLREEAERRREERARDGGEKGGEKGEGKETEGAKDSAEPAQMGQEKEGEEKNKKSSRKAQAGASDRVAEESVEAVHTPQDALGPTEGDERRKRRSGSSGVPPKHKDLADATIHESPAPHDRHLTALTYGCLASSSLLPTLLSGVPASNPGLTLIQGPPGTGKTKRLIDELERLVEKGHRCLVCGPSNLNACDLYVRCMRRGIYGCLSLSKEHMPPGVPRRSVIELARSQVVFSTVCGRSSPALLRQPFDCVLLDEAGRCSEAHAWGLLRREVVHLAMAGDVNQLQEQVSERGAPLHHGRSMLERLIGLGVEHESLTVQHRMHPSILRFPNDAFYGGALRTAEGKEGGGGGGGEGGGGEADAAYAVVRVEGGEERREGTSYENDAEAEECVRQARMLADRFGEGAGQGSEGSRVVILTPYLAQARRLLSKRSGIEVCTVDASQGKEWDAVVLSIVRTEAEGFWSEKGRLAVALTRAKHAMRVVMSDRWFGSTDGTTLLSRLSGSGLLGGGDRSRNDGDAGGEMQDDEMAMKGGAA